MNALERYGEAAEAARTSVRLKPTKISGVTELVEALIKLGKFDEATEAFEEFTKRGGVLRFGQLVLVGYCQYMLGQIDKAIEIIKELK